MLDHTISIQFMLGGYAAFFVLFMVYVVSLLVRWRNLKRELKSLDEMEKKQ